MVEGIFKRVFAGMFILGIASIVYYIIKFFVINFSAWILPLLAFIAFLAVCGVVGAIAFELAGLMAKPKNSGDRVPESISVPSGDGYSQEVYYYCHKHGLDIRSEEDQDLHKGVELGWPT